MNQDTGAAVGHMPMENSRATKFLLDRGARVVLFVTSTNYCVLPWCSGVVVITTAQLYSTAQAQILLAACRRSAMVRISDQGPGCKKAKCLSSVNHTTKTIHPHQFSTRWARNSLPS